jgi:hypothetical protein
MSSKCEKAVASWPLVSPPELDRRAVRAIPPKPKTEYALSLWLQKSNAPADHGVDCALAPWAKRRSLPDDTAGFLRTGGLPSFPHMNPTGHSWKSVLVIFPCRGRVRELDCVFAAKRDQTRGGSGDVRSALAVAPVLSLRNEFAPALGIAIPSNRWQKGRTRWDLSEREAGSRKI